jgi:hypothetical protein
VGYEHQKTQAPRINQDAALPVLRDLWVSLRTANLCRGEGMSAGPYRHFGGMCWPVPSPALGEVEWTMRYDDPLPSDRMVAASVIDAFNELVRLPAKKRNAIIRELRKGPGRSDG